MCVCVHSTFSKFRPILCVLSVDIFMYLIKFYGNRCTVNALRCRHQFGSTSIWLHSSWCKQNKNRVKQVYTWYIYSLLKQEKKRRCTQNSSEIEGKKETRKIKLP